MKQGQCFNKWNFQRFYKKGIIGYIKTSQASILNKTPWIEVLQ